MGKRKTERKNAVVKYEPEVKQIHIWFNGALMVIDIHDKPQYECRHGTIRSLTLTSDMEEELKKLF